MVNYLYELNTIEKNQAIQYNNTEKKFDFSHKTLVNYKNELKESKKQLNNVLLVRDNLNGEKDSTNIRLKANYLKYII